MKCQCRTEGCFHGKHKCTNFAFVEVLTKTKVKVYFCMTCATLNSEIPESEMEINTQ